MIGKADALLVEGCAKVDAVIAQAWLMRANVELRLRERRSRLAVATLERMPKEFVCYTFSAPLIVATPDATGFIITLSNGDNRPGFECEINWGVVLTWAMGCAKPFVDAGWQIRYAFYGVEACSTENGHEFYYMEADRDEPWKLPIRRPMPYCCRCAAPRPVA